MKIFALMFILPLFGFVASNEKLNECNGFGNFVFGTTKESYKNLSFEVEEGGSRLYEAGPNAIHVEGVQFEYIRVTFTHNQLSAIALSTKNATAAVFFKTLTSRYGNPLKVKKHFEWLGKNVRIVYEPYTRNNDAAVDFYKR
jgi:hypothetical protein